MDRRAELEKKRQKLMEIRELKKQRLEQREATTNISIIESVPAKDTPVVGSSQISSTNSSDLTDILNLCDSFDNKNRNAEPNVELTVPNLETSISTSEIKPSVSELVLSISIDRNPITIPLTFSSAPQMSIAPSENETYEKQTQTVITSTDSNDGDDDDEEDEVDSSSFDLSNNPKVQNDPVPEKIETKPKRLEYKEQERKYLMQSESFQKFLDRAIRITERSLSTMDSIVHKTVDDMELVDSQLQLKSTFMDQRWSKNRAVTSLDWNTQYPELLLASYNQNETQPNEPNGLCLVWNMKFPNKTTPEYVFHSPSPVMSACYAKFHPNIVLGGTYSGQICLWDNRVNKRVPVQSSRISAKAHTHPIYCLKVVGTSNSHNLISISNDGTMCSWNLDMLSSPLETMVLREPNKYKRRIQVMSMAFIQDDYNNFLLGSQDGSIYSASRHGTKTGILSAHQGQEGPVTSVDFHSAPTNSTQYDFSHLYLSTSFDWTFKLWSTQSGERPLYTYEDGSDYMFDARWSPIHPTLFATVDGLGRVDIWNLNRDTELPTVSTFVAEGGMSAPNRLSWSPNGRQLVVGDDGGRIVVYEVGEELAVPKKDEWYRFSKTLRKFTSNEIV